jgi:hypothetical protein
MRYYFNPYSDLGRVGSVFERMQPGFKEEHPKCVDDQGHYFKTCGTCFTMICRRCEYKTIDFFGQMTTTYGDFSGTSAPYDRYCDECEVLLQRGTEGWKCYEDYEKHRLEIGDTVCRTCKGSGSYTINWVGGPETIKCTYCDGTGEFPTPYRKIQIKQGKKITEIIDEPWTKRVIDWVRIFIHNNNPRSVGIIKKLRKLSIR